MATSSSLVKENASNIANKLLNKHPNLKIFLNILLKDIDVEVKEVGRKFQYPPGIIKYKLFNSNGIFMDYFIRKVLANKFEIQITDNYAEIVLNDKNTYFTGKAKQQNLSKRIKKNYIIYKDTKSLAMDIIESIKIVSQATILFFHDPLPKAKVEIDEDNLLEVKKYFDKLPYTRVEIKLNVDCEYFEGNADIIFDQKVLYEVKTSQYPSFDRHNQNMANFYKLILYGFGYYKKTGKILKLYKIYNPLLSQVYTIELNNIDMAHFEEAIKEDVRIWKQNSK